jgi:hypothetical protein
VRFRLAVAAVFALGAMLAHAQGRALPLLVGPPGNNTTMLPVIDSTNGQITGVMLIEPSSLPVLPSQRVIRPANTPLMFNNGLQLRAGLSLDANPGVGVLCNSPNGLNSVGALGGHCLLADFNQPNNGRAARGTINGMVQAQRGQSQLSASVGVGNDLLDGANDLVGGAAADRRLLSTLLGPDSALIDQRSASLVGQINVGSQGWLQIGGTMARIRVIPTAQLPRGLPAEWNTSRFSVGAGKGSIGGEVTGQMIEVPGQPSNFTTLGAGVTWRTPWRAKVSVGADNLLTRGKNPFGPATESRLPDGKDEGRVPYVRYQQDL